MYYFYLNVYNPFFLQLYFKTDLKNTVFAKYFLYLKLSKGYAINDPLILTIVFMDTLGKMLFWCKIACLKFTKESIFYDLSRNFMPII